LEDDWRDLGYEVPAVAPQVTGIVNSLIRAYLLALGEFGLDDEGILEANYTYGYVGWLIFLLATLINFIIMCNLLISIFSRTHEKFTEVKEQETMRSYT